MRHHFTIIFFITVTTSLISCSEINTNDPQKSYKYWAGSKPSKDTEILNGQYWESAHWSYEYEVFLQIRVNQTWWDNFIKENKLIKDTVSTDISLTQIYPLKEKPQWFRPSSRSATYKQTYKHFDQGSRYYYDSLTSTCYIFEIQL